MFAYVLAIPNPGKKKERKEDIIYTLTLDMTTGYIPVYGMFGLSIPLVLWY